MNRPPIIRLFNDEHCADLFAGGGGTSTGIESVLGRSPDVAINHDPEALAMHETNHPGTEHACENVFDVHPEQRWPGRRWGFAWFSPDCTFHSKARGGKPFRDPNRARRIRGLAGIVVRWAAQVRPRILFVENVEEFKDWCPLDADGVPDATKRGANFRRWVSRLRNLGYDVDWRELRACDFGSPTSRKRLFVIARCDGRPIVWPSPTHGPKTAQPYRTAAECIDWSIPIPSIFLNKREAKAWGKAHGVNAPLRPLAPATMRRIARGLQRFVINSPQPFIVKYHAGSPRVHSVEEPIRTLDTANRFALIAPTLIQTSYGERKGQAPRTLDLHAPLGTVVAGGIKHSLVAAFLAKHNAGHEATGQKVLKPLDTVTTRDSKALVTSHLVKLYGTSVTGASVTEPLPTVTATGNHLAEVRAFLVKFFGSKKDGKPMQLPLDTVTTKERFGLVTVTIDGEEYAIVDIGMRMLTPRELFRAQGFPADYRIEAAIGTRFRDAGPLTKKAQTRLVGNSVPPHVAAALIRANLAPAKEVAA